MPLPGNRITLLETGDDFFPALETAIDGAVAEVHLETYIFADDPTGRRIADALVRAAQRGVVVRLMVDGFGSSNLRPPLRRRLAAGGTKMRILVYRPERGLLWFKRGRLRRLHRKLAVIDGRIGFCGGINIHDDRDGRGEGEPRFDYAVRVEGPLVADMQDVMQRLWRLVRWTTLGKRTGFPLVRPRRGKPFDDGIAAAFVIRDNVRNRGAIEEEYLDAIRRARREVIICNAYFLPGRRIRHALRDAVRRGVRVRLLLQGKREYFWVHYASRALYGSLVEAGIEIHTYMSAMMHAKVAVVDDDWCTIGSSNIDPFSLLLAREANVVLHDTAFAHALRVSLQRAIDEDAVPVLPEEWAAQPWLERLLCWIGYGMTRAAVGLIAGGGRETQNG